jgi:hypothetical protein
MLSGMLSSSWYVYAWALFERMPEDGFKCRDNISDPWETCEKDASGEWEFCENPNIIWEPKYETN